MSGTYPRVFLAGHRGMVGSAILRRMREQGWPEPLVRTRTELDLCDQRAVFDFLKNERPEAVIVAAALVGGIEANRTHPAEFLYQNVTIASHLIHGAWLAKIPRLLYLGSSCIYPRLAPQPIPEEALLSGALEPTNEGYAVAKIAGMKLCQFYRREHGMLSHSAMPTNLYGPGDNYDPENSHVLPSLIRKFVEARDRGGDEVLLWGTGAPRREFLHVDDLAAAVLFLMGLDNPPDWVNVGSGEEVTIREAAELVRQAVGAGCKLRFDAVHPDGTPRKLLDSRLLRSLGWQPKIGLAEGIRRTVADYELERREGRLRKSRMHGE